MKSLTKKLGMIALGTGLVLGTPGCSKAGDTGDNSQGYAENVFGEMFNFNKRKGYIQEINLQKFNFREYARGRVDMSERAYADYCELKDSEKKPTDTYINFHLECTGNLISANFEKQTEKMKINDEKSKIYFISPQNVKIKSVYQFDKKFGIGKISRMRKPPEDMVDVLKHKKIQGVGINSLPKKSFDYIIRDLREACEENGHIYSKNEVIEKVKKRYHIKKIPFTGKGSKKSLGKSLCFVSSNEPQMHSLCYVVPRIVFEDSQGEKELSGMFYPILISKLEPGLNLQKTPENTPKYDFLEKNEEKEGNEKKEGYETGSSLEQELSVEKK